MSSPDTAYLLQRIEDLNAIGMALSSENDTPALLEKILLGAKRLTGADAGTLYLLTADQRHLRFETVRNDTLGITLGGTTGQSVPFDPVPLYRPGGEPNTQSVVAYAVLNNRTVNIADAYHADGFDFRGTRLMDEKTGYRSKSFLTIPLRNHENQIIGVLQLINATHPTTRDIVPFSPQDQNLAESLASQAAVSLTKQMLIEDQKRLFEAFIELIAKAIDEKNPTTSRHCQRVPHLALMLAEAINNTDQGAFATQQFTAEELYELKIAAWLHDCGKITTPEHVLNKGTKLQTLFDRVSLVDARFDIIRRDLEITHWRAVAQGDPNHDQTWLAKHIQQLEDDQAFVRKANVGGEFMRNTDQERIKDIANRYRFRDASGQECTVLTEDEIHNLCIPRGTLTDEERQIINNHVAVTIKMLESLPYPRYLRRVPEIAGGHHERCDGKGYPRGLCGNELSLQAKILVIADIFEALSAQDRPYKPGKNLTESLTILGHMKQDGHIDGALFDLFIRSGVYLRYGQRFLTKEQVDSVDLSRIPGYAN